MPRVTQRNERTSCVYRFVCSILLRMRALTRPCSMPCADMAAIGNRLRGLGLPGLSWKKLPVFIPRARPPGPAAGTSWRLPARGSVHRTLRRTLESAKSLKSRVFAWTDTRPVYAGVSKSIRLFHGARGSEGPSLRTRAQTRHVRQSTASGVKEYRLRRRDRAAWRDIGEGRQKPAISTG